MRGLEKERKNKTGNKRKNRVEEKKSRRETQRKKKEPPTSQRHGTQPQHRPPPPAAPLGRGSTSSSSSSSSSPGCSTVHVACEQWRVSLLFVLVFWAGQRWPNPKWLGRVQPSQEKKFLQNFFLKKYVIFPRIFLLNFS